VKGAARPPRGLLAGVGLLLLLGLLALLAPWISGGATDVDLGAVLEPPSGAHPMGTDGLGRDLVGRVLFGARVSLTVGLLAAALALLAGIPLGAVAGYRGGLADALVSRALETMLCFPGFVLALAILGAAPPWLAALPDVLKVGLVIGIAGWIPVARYIRAEFQRLSGSEMVLAARSTGAGHLRVAARHILPSALAPVLVTAAFTVAAAITAEATLSFLGLGVRPPTPTWGGLLFEAKSHVDRAWWLVVFPGLALFLAVLACNLVGEGLRDWLDPRGARR
jgi:peptide/nickel transport system permease protein